MLKIQFLILVALSAFIRGSHPIEIEVRALRETYLDLEQRIWNFIKSDNLNINQGLNEILLQHRWFVNASLLHQNYNRSRYGFIDDINWNDLERVFKKANRKYPDFRLYLHASQVNDSLLLADWTHRILREFPKDIFEQIVQTTLTRNNLFYSIAMNFDDEMCKRKQCAQHFIYELSESVALAELKIYILQQFALMILHVLQPREISECKAVEYRQAYKQHTENAMSNTTGLLKILQRSIWRCDPDQHVRNETYDEVTRLLQGYIVNEIDMNTDETCSYDCPRYQEANGGNCYKQLYCSRQKMCSGKLYDCNFVARDMWVCVSNNASPRRYEHIEYENGVIYGRKQYCPRGLSLVESWYGFFVSCDYCMCLCDEQGSKSDRYFNLRPIVSDTKSNKVVTGVRFVKLNRVFYLQIQEGVLMPHGDVDAETVSWKAIDTYSISNKSIIKEVDYHLLDYAHRAIDLDDIVADEDFCAVTGVRFRLLGAHLNLEIQLTPFNPSTGLLDKSVFIWKSNDLTDVNKRNKRSRMPPTIRKQLRLNNADIPIYSSIKSKPDSKNNEFMEFTNTDLRKDVGQTTVPFIDIQEVTSNLPKALAGIGIHHKGANGFGGFIAPKIFSLDILSFIKK